MGAHSRMKVGLIYSMLNGVPPIVFRTKYGIAPRREIVTIRSLCPKNNEPKANEPGNLCLALSCRAMVG